MNEMGRSILQGVSIMFITLLFLGCIVRVVNKKGTWVDGILAVMSVPSWIFVVCV